MPPFAIPNVPASVTVPVVAVDGVNPVVPALNEDTGLYPNAVVTSLEVNVTAPVRVLKLVTGVPLLAAVILPYASTVNAAYVYEPAVTAVVAKPNVIVPDVVIGEPELVS